MKLKINFLAGALGVLVAGFIMAHGQLAAVSADLAPTKIEGHYVGTWVDANQNRHGVANCVVKQISNQCWIGKFWGDWDHDDFEYTAKLCGEPVTWNASIHGVEYQWTGTLTPSVFAIKFTSAHLSGHMELVRVDDNAVAASP